MFDWFTTPEGVATVAFLSLVLVPLGRRLAKRTRTPVDDQAVSLLERALALVGLARRR